MKKILVASTVILTLHAMQHDHLPNYKTFKSYVTNRQCERVKNVYKTLIKQNNREQQQNFLQNMRLPKLRQRAETQIIVDKSSRTKTILSRTATCGAAASIFALSTLYMQSPDIFIAAFLSGAISTMGGVIPIFLKTDSEHIIDVLQNLENLQQELDATMHVSIELKELTSMEMFNQNIGDNN